MKTFKEELKDNWIPFVEKITVTEKNHLDFLESRLEEANNFNPFRKFFISESFFSNLRYSISYSKCMLSHYNQRLEEYKKHLESLN